MAPHRSAPVELDLGRVLELLRTHITAALCRTVFATLRITERQRRWTLQALVQFWLAVILRAPRALSQALYETLEGSEPLFPLVQASPEAFFQRCQSLRPAFFAEVFARFTARLLQATPAASAPVRAARRHKELAEAGINRLEAEILAELEARDKMDRERHASPLKPADGAIIIDTDALALEDVIDRVHEAAVAGP